MVKEQVLSALKHVLEPLVRLLLRNGVTWGEFAELGKEVFVQVARDDYGIQGRPTNTSRVALMTGLSRREVMRVKTVLTGELAREPAPGRFSQILTAWHIEPPFQNPDGDPAVLPESGDGASLATLMKRHAGDTPHGAVVKELEKLGLIARAPGGYKVMARDYIRSPADPDLIRQAGASLHDHAATVAYNVNADRSGPPRFERMATHRSFPGRLQGEFAAFLEAEGRAFLERTDQWLTARAGATTDDVAAPAGDPLIRTGVGIFLIHEPTQRQSP